MSGTDASRAPALVLHIGRNKAGSTALQDFCAAHADWLAGQGVRYALLGHLADSAPGLPSFATHGHLADFVRLGGTTVLASNEMLSALPPPVLGDIARDLADLDLQVVLYLRPYGAWLRSCYGYEVQGGQNGRDFDAYFEHALPKVSIWPALQEWGDALGWHRLRVRSTVAADLTGGGVIQDCLTTVGLAPPPGSMPFRRNASPHWMAVELLRMAITQEAAPGWDFHGLAIAEALHELADEAILASGARPADAAYLRPDQADALAGLYRDDLRRLHDRTGTRLTPDHAAHHPARPFLPSAAHVPAGIVARIADLASRPDYARLHPEMAAFVQGERFAALAGRDRAGVARHRGQPYLATQYRAIGETMQGDLAETMSEPRKAEAFRLAAQGDYAAAIELGTGAVRSGQDADLLAALAIWRRDGFGRVAHPPGPAAWPPCLPDPFPGTTGIPAISASELTADILGGAILHHGSLRVNGLVPPAAAEALRAGVDRALSAQEAANDGRADDHPDWYVPLDVPSLVKARQWSQGCGAVWTADSPPMLAAVIEALRACGALDTIAELMGERPALSVAKSTLRRVLPAGGHDWHQDGAFLGRNVRSVNVWLALSPCGSAAPGMDVVGARLPYILQTHSHGAYFDWSVGNGLVDILAEGGAPVETPEFGAGDALLFDHMMLHRTSVKPGMTGTRWAVESWFFAPTDYPYDQVPLLV